MERSIAELAQTERFDEAYRIGGLPLMRSITDAVCECGYVGTSWTTQSEAEALLDLLRLSPQLHLLELGAGAGWPGLYLVKQSGCRALLVDLPETGLAMARDRAEADGIAGQIETLAASAANLLLPPGSFGAINHSDLLCCLPAKRAVLERCRSVLAAGGRMVFSVIKVAPGLSPAQRTEAVICGPDFIESELDYPNLLEMTGWRTLQRRDLTTEYQAACERQIAADDLAGNELRSVFDDAALAERAARWRRKLAAIRDRLTLRELYVVEPAG